MQSHESPLASLLELSALHTHTQSTHGDPTKSSPVPQPVQPKQRKNALLPRASGPTSEPSLSTSSHVAKPTSPSIATKAPSEDLAPGASLFEQAKTEASPRIAPTPQIPNDDEQLAELRPNVQHLDSQRTDDAHRITPFKASFRGADALPECAERTSAQRPIPDVIKPTHPSVPECTPDIFISTPTPTSTPPMQDFSSKAAPSTTHSSAKSSTDRIHESPGEESSSSYHTGRTSVPVPESSSVTHTSNATIPTAFTPTSHATPSSIQDTIMNSAEAVLSSPSGKPHPSRTTSHPILPSPSGSPGFPGRRQGAPTHFPSFPHKAFTSSMNSPSLRLSPAIISRHKPMPILNLPLILPRPVETPGAEGSGTRTGRSRLRSLPALPIQGKDTTGDNEDDLELEPDIEEGDEGEDDEDGDSSPDEDEHEGGAAAVSPSRGLQLPTIDTSSITMPDFARPFFFQKGKQREASFASEASVMTRSSIYFTPFSEDHSNEPTETDYFTSRSLASGSSARTPIPKDVDPLRTPMAEPPLRRAQPSISGLSFPRPTPGGHRPSIHKQASRSMIDLTPMVQPRGQSTPIAEDDLPLQVIADRNNGVAPGNDTSGQDKTKGLGPAPAYHTLRPRRSMPTFNPNTRPPPYPADLPPFRHPHSAPANLAPREDEGKEELPRYSNDVYLTAIMPRKMEFTKPGVQAKDRKWRRTLCVLEGTVFKVYKCPAGVSGTNAISEWWERRVGVPDSTDPTVPKTLSDHRRLRAGPERVMKWEEEEARARPEGESHIGPSRDTTPPRPSPLSQNEPYSNSSPSRSRLSVTNLLKPVRKHQRSRSSDPRASPSSANASPRASLSTSRPSLQDNGGSSGSGGNSSSVNLSAPTRSSVSSSRSSFSSITRSRAASSATNPSERADSPLGKLSPDSPVAPPKAADLVRAYTLQGAESGLGNDYLKRKNVIRARMEGEQFLLQAKDVAAVIEWIEGIHAGTNVSLDLDERPMPRGPLFPRRRRRRVRPPEPAPTRVPGPGSSS